MSVDPELLLQRADWVRRLASGMAYGVEDAEDLVQEALLTALKSKPREGVPLGRWLTAVTRNLARGRVRREGRRHDRELRVARPEQDPRQADPSESLERLETHEQLVEALRELREPYREVVLWRYFDELTPTEISRRNGTPLRTVHTQLRRGLELLRESMNRRTGRDARGWLPVLLTPGSRMPGPEMPGAELPGVEMPGPEAASAAATSVASHLVQGLLMNAKVKLSLALLACLGLLFAVRTLSQAQGSPPGGPGRVEPALLAAPAQAVPKLAEVVPPAPAPDGRSDVSAGTRAGVPAHGAQAEWTPTGETVRGRVLDWQGRPVGGVEVAYLPYAAGPEPGGLSEPGDLTEPGNRAGAVESAADGLFELGAEVLGGSPNGRLVVAGERWGAVLEPVLSPAAFEELEAYIVVVAPRIVLSGQVWDSEGASVGGAELTVLLPESVRSQSPHALDASRRVQWSTESGADGSFSLVTVAVEGATLHARAGGLIARRMDCPEISAKIDIVLECPEGGAEQIVGRVVDPGGRAVEGAQVALGFQHAQTGPDGEFVLRRTESRGGPAVEGRMTAVKAGFLPGFAERRGNSDVAPDAWPEPLEIRLGGAPLSLGGRVVDSTGEPRPGVLVHALGLTPFGSVAVPGQPSYSMLAFVETMLGGHSESKPVRTDAEGRFQLDGLMEREYELRVVDRRHVIAEVFGPYPAGNTSLTLRLHTPELIPRLAGRVVGLAGQPVGQAGVRAVVTSGDVLVAEDPGLPGAPTPANFITGESSPVGEDGQFELLEVSAATTHISVAGKNIGFGHRFPLPPGANLEQLEFRVPMRRRFRVELSDGAELATSFELLDADGTAVMLYIAEGDHGFSSRVGILSGGRSQVCSAAETATRMVVHFAQGEPREYPIRLTDPELTLIRP